MQKVEGKPSGPFLAMKPEIVFLYVVDFLPGR